MSRLSSPFVVSEEPVAKSATTTANLSTRKAIMPQPIAVGSRAPVDDDQQVRQLRAPRSAIAGHADAVIKRRAARVDPVFVDSSPIMAVLFLVRKRCERPTLLFRLG